MKDNKVRFTLRTNQELHHKFAYIAKEEGRSINRQYEMLMKWYIRIYEERQKSLKSKKELSSKEEGEKEKIL